MIKNTRYSELNTPDKVSRATVPADALVVAAIIIFLTLLSLGVI
jgi:hypothetical protein